MPTLGYKAVLVLSAFVIGIIAFDNGWALAVPAAALAVLIIPRLVPTRQKGERKLR